MVPRMKKRFFFGSAIVFKHDLKMKGKKKKTTKN